MATIRFAQAINDALSTAMALDPNVICYGLGVDDPKGVFGTTLGLSERFGPERVFDMPTSENAMTGIGIGAALYGLRPVMTHQRLDFALLSMDQLVNNAAKWRFMFARERGLPLTIRMILGAHFNASQQVEATRATISPESDPVSVPVSSASSRPVRSTEAAMAGQSIGRTLRRSMRSQAMPCGAR